VIRARDRAHVLGPERLLALSRGLVWAKRAADSRVGQPPPGEGELRSPKRGPRGDSPAADFDRGHDPVDGIPALLAEPRQRAHHQPPAGACPAGRHPPRVQHLSSGAALRRRGRSPAQAHGAGRARRPTRSQVALVHDDVSLGTWRPALREPDAVVPALERWPVGHRARSARADHARRRRAIRHDVDPSRSAPRSYSPALHSGPGVCVRPAGVSAASAPRCGAAGADGAVLFVRGVTFDHFAALSRAVGSYRRSTASLRHPRARAGPLPLFGHGARAARRPVPDPGRRAVADPPRDRHARDAGPRTAASGHPPISIVAAVATPTATRSSCSSRWRRWSSCSSPVCSWPASFDRANANSGRTPRGGG
jgi:hypothetical protein